MGSTACTGAFFKNRKWDIIALGILIGISMWLISNSCFIGVDPNNGYDYHSYIKLAENPLAFYNQSIPGIHAQRIFGPILVWTLKSIFNLPLESAFRIVSDASFFLFVILFYLVLRGAKVRPSIAFATSVFSVISSWPATYSLANVYQVCDAMTYPMVLLMIILTVKQKTNALLLVSVIGVLTRQPLLVMSFCAFLYLYLKDKKPRNILYFSLIVTIFLYTSIFAGYQAVAGLLECTVTNAKLSNVLLGLKRTQFPLLFSPFLLVFFNRDTFTYIKKYWWVSLYAILVISSPFFIFFDTLEVNVVRQIFQGIMPTFLLAGILLNGTLTRPSSRAIYCLLPFAYGLVHLSFMKHTYPPLVGHRYVMIVVIVLLQLWDMATRGKRAQPGSKNAALPVARA